MKYKYFIAEGPQKAFEKLWNSICGKKPGCSWEDNPCVRAVEFEIKEAGELTKAVLEWVFQDGDFAELEKEAIQVGAMAVRFLANLDKYKEWK